VGVGSVRNPRPLPPVSHMSPPGWAYVHVLSVCPLPMGMRYGIACGPMISVGYTRFSGVDEARQTAGFRISSTLPLATPPLGLSPAFKIDGFAAADCWGWSSKNDPT
jgi:hypothetical protein